MRILIADDHEFVRRGVRSVLLTRSDFDVCGEAVDGQDAIEQARHLIPDLIVMDVSMPNLNGLEATRKIQQILPHISVLILSQHDSPEMMRQALNAGARGYVVKSAISEDLVAGIDTLSRGEMFFDPAISKSADTNLDVQEILRRSAAFETALRESEERFRLTFDQAAIGIAHVDEGGRWLRVNQKLSEIVGYTQDELRRLTYQDITHPDYLAENVAHSRQLAAGKIDHYSVEKRYIRKDGTPVWVNVTVAPVRDIDRRLKYFICVVEDISARKDAERRQEQAATQQKALFHLADELHRSSSIGDVYSAALNAILAALQCNRASILLYDKRDTMRFVEWRGLSHKYRTAVEGHSAWSPDDPNPLPVCIDDIATADLPDSLKALLKDEGVAAMAFIPLVSNGKLIGKFMAYFNDAHDFSDGEIELSLTIARQLAFGIERQRSEDALRRSESRFRDLSERLECLRAEAETERGKLREMFMQAPAVIAFLSGAEHRFIFINREGLRMSGRERVEDLVGKPIREAMPELEPQGYFELLDQVYRTGVPFVGNEMPVVLKRAHDVQAPESYVTFIFQPIRDAVGDIEGIMVHAVEVTAHVIARQSIEHSEQRRRLAAEAAHIGIWEWDPSENTRTLSPELHRIFGTDATDPSYTEKWASRIHTDDKQRLLQQMDEGRHSGNLDFEYRYHHPELGLRWLHCKGSRFQNESRMFGVGLDITERKQSEDILRQHRERFEFVTQSSQIGFWFCDLPFDKLIWDNRVKEHFWLPPDAEVTIDTFYERLHPEDRERTRHAIEESNANDKPYDIEYRTVAPDGRQKWIRAIGRTFYNEAGQPKRFDGLTLDVTDRKQTEENYRSLAETLEAEVRARTRELEEQNAHALRQSEQLRELSWQLMKTQDEERRHIARELHDSAGQTLAVLGMNLASLVERTKNRAPEIAQSANETQKLVQQLTNEIRTTSYLLHPPLLDENGLTAALPWYIRGLAERSGIDIAFKISEEFGRLPREIELVIFRLVQECLTNIHRHSGSKAGEIQVIREPERVLVQVRDEGKGISPWKLAEIQSAASGMGIRGMRERLRQFNDELMIDSTTAGTTVVVTIPVSKDEWQAPPMAPRTLESAV